MTRIALALSMTFLVACGVRAGNPDIPTGKVSDYEGLSGRVTILAENGEPGLALKGATVTIGDSTVETGPNGEWRIDEPPSPDGKAVVVSIRKTGFASDLLRLSASRAAGRYLETSLRQYDVFERISGEEGGELVIPAEDGSRSVEITIPPFSIPSGVTEADFGVTVIRPEVEREWSRFPGELVGLADDLNQGTDLLRSFGMLTVDIRNTDGEEVEPSFSSNPQVQMQIDESIADGYDEGSEIRTWTLNVEGQWKAEGVAKVSRREAGLFAKWETSHFSTWNLDAPLENHACVALSLTPKDERTRVIMEDLVFELDGVDYAYRSPAAEFTDGFAVATAWRAKDAHLTIRFAGTQGDAIQVLEADGDPLPSQVTLPDREGSTKWDNPDFNPREQCLLIERSVIARLSDVHGKVFDDHGIPLANAIIGLAGYGRSVITGDDGTFLFADVPWNPDGSRSVTLHVIPPWERSDLEFLPQTLLRNVENQAVELWALPGTLSPSIPRLFQKASRAVTGSSTPFEVELVDDGTSLQLGLSVCGATLTAKYESERKDTRVTLCHVPPGEENQERSLHVDAEAVAAHLEHGDYEGVCASATPETAPDFTAFPVGAGIPAADRCEGRAEVVSANITDDGAVMRVLVQGLWHGGSQAGAQSLRVIAKDDLGYQTYAGMTLDLHEEQTVSSLNLSGAPGDTVTMTFGGSVDLLSSIHAGEYYTCGLSDTGSVFCWGYNSWGELGNGTTASSTTPVQVSGLTSGNVAITDHCVLTAGGGVKCWGTNYPGNGTNAVVTEPVDVTGLQSGVAAISSFDWASACALMNTGGVKCWGTNDSGQVGDGTYNPALSPVDVSGLVSGVSQIVVGDMHACALLGAGGVRCWGWGGTGGNGTETDQLSPAEVTGLTGVTYLTAGADHTCALLSTGGVQCWGHNLAGAIGDSSPNNATTPVDVFGLTSGVLKVEAGAYHTCALMQAAPDTLKCWGSNWEGEMGYSGGSALSPVDIVFDGDILAFHAGESFTCAILNGNRLQCLGANWGGQLGEEPLQSTSSPIYSRVPGSVSIGSARAEVTLWESDAVSFIVPSLPSGEYDIQAKVWDLLTAPSRFTVTP